MDSGEDIDLLTVVASELDFNTQYVVSSCEHCKADNISIALEDILEIATPFRRNAMMFSIAYFLARNQVVDPVTLRRMDWSEVNYMCEQLSKELEELNDG